MEQTLTATQTIIAGHDQFMSMNYGRYPVAMVRGEGIYCWDAEGVCYLDLFAGFGGPILGHCHPAQLEAVTQQAKTLWHVGNMFHTAPQVEFAEKLHQTAFGGKSFFCHSGADANEAAIKLARVYGRQHPNAAGEARYKILTTRQSFHGRTFAAMMATGQDKVHKGYEPLLEGFGYVPFNDVDAMKAATDDRTVAIMVEPIQGEGGVNVPDHDYLPKLRTFCDEQDMLLIVDEVWTGCGRTGKWFAHQHDLTEDQSPDVMTLAKGVGGGLAVGVVHVSPRVEDCFDFRKQGGVVHATTLGGNCLSMAVAASIFDVIETEGLLEHAAELGEYAMGRLRDFAADHPVITQVRGRGLFIGIELDFAKADLPYADAGELVRAALLDHQLILNTCQGDVLRIAPAMVISRDELDEGLSRLEAMLG